MAFNRNIWEKLSFDANRNPPWPCPSCSGPLSKRGDIFYAIHSKDLPQSISNLTKEEVLNLAYVEYRFLGVLDCNSCHLEVVTSGYAYAVDKFNSPVSHGYTAKKGKVLFPISFDPALKIISASKNCPFEILKQLDNAFHHYWNDKSSCANRIRAIVELIMDDNKIPNGKTSLHRRIEKFKKLKHKALGDSLESIKWIGNAGSHIQNISKDDLLDAFELLDHVLNELYKDETNTSRIQDLTNRVNLNKGPVSKKNKV
jgi:hypothetical protein